MPQKICLVVGGTGGLGGAIAQHIATKQYTVIIAGRNETTGHAIIHSIVETGGKAIFIPCDLSSDSSIQALPQSQPGWADGCVADMNLEP